MAFTNLNANGRRVTATYRIFGRPHICAYCGETADTIDHAVPQWLAQQNVAIAKLYTLVAVHSCLNCNVLAGGVVDKTFTARRARIAKKLKRRAGSVLRTVLHTEQEISEIGPGLRDMIEDTNAKAALVRWRLRVLTDPNLPPGIPDDLFQPADDPLKTP